MKVKFPQLHSIGTNLKCLFNYEPHLIIECIRHSLAVPFQAIAVFFIIVKKMSLCVSLLNVWMHIEHFNEGPRAALAYSNDNCTRKSSLSALDIIEKYYQMVLLARIT